MCRYGAKLHKFEEMLAENLTAFLNSVSSGMVLYAILFNQKFMFGIFSVECGYIFVTLSWIIIFN